MRKTGVIYGSDTGSTEGVVEVLVSQWKESYPTQEIEVIEVADIESTETFLNFDLLVLGIPTWYDGDLQSDWEDYFDNFKTIDFSDKVVAVFGLGDQIGYDEYFVDGIGILAKVVLENGGTVIGNWPTKGYEHSASKAEKDKETFYGLAIDEDNYAERTEEYLDTWLKQLDQEWAALC